MYSLFVYIFYVYIVFTADNQTKVDCTVDSNCTQAQICVRGICIDLCTNSCAKSALCTAQEHKVKCTCPPGYEGNASVECFPIVSVTVPTPITPIPTRDRKLEVEEEKTKATATPYGEFTGTTPQLPHVESTTSTHETTETLPAKEEEMSTTTTSPQEKDIFKTTEVVTLYKSNGTTEKFSGTTGVVYGKTTLKQEKESIYPTMKVVGITESSSTETAVSFAKTTNTVSPETPATQTTFPETSSVPAAETIKISKEITTEKYKEETKFFYPSTKIGYTTEHVESPTRTTSTAYEETTSAVIPEILTVHTTRAETAGTEEQKEYEAVTTGKYKEETELAYQTTKIGITTGYPEIQSRTTETSPEETTGISFPGIVRTQPTFIETTSAEEASLTTEQTRGYKETTTPTAFVDTTGYSKSISTIIYKPTTAATSPETVTAQSKIAGTTSAPKLEESFSTTEKGVVYEQVAESVYPSVNLPSTAGYTESSFKTTGIIQGISVPSTSPEIPAIQTEFAETTRALMPKETSKTTETPKVYEGFTKEKYTQETKTAYPSTESLTTAAGLFEETSGTLYPETVTAQMETASVPFGEKPLETTVKTTQYEGITTVKYKEETLYPTTELTETMGYPRSSSRMTEPTTSPHTLLSQTTFTETTETPLREHTSKTTGKSTYPSTRFSSTTSYPESIKASVEEKTGTVFSEVTTAQTEFTPTVSVPTTEYTFITTGKTKPYPELTTGKYKEGTTEKTEEKTESFYPSTELLVTTNYSEHSSETTHGPFEETTATVSGETRFAQTISVPVTEKTLELTEKTKEYKELTTGKYKEETESFYTTKGTTGHPESASRMTGIVYPRTEPTIRHETVTTSTTVAERTTASLQEESSQATETSKIYEEITTGKYEKGKEFYYTSTVFASTGYPEGSSKTQGAPFEKTTGSISPEITTIKSLFEQTASIPVTEQALMSTGPTRQYDVATTRKHTEETESVYPTLKVAGTTGYPESSSRMTSPETATTQTIFTTYPSAVTGYPESTSFQRTTGTVSVDKTKITGPVIPVTQQTLETTEKVRQYEEVTTGKYKEETTKFIGTTEIVYPETEHTTSHETLTTKATFAGTTRASLETEVYKEEITTGRFDDKTSSPISATTAGYFKETTGTVAIKVPVTKDISKTTKKPIQYEGVTTRKHEEETESMYTTAFTVYPKSSSKSEAISPQIITAQSTLPGATGTPLEGETLSTTEESLLHGGRITGKYKEETGPVSPSTSTDSSSKTTVASFEGTTGTVSFETVTPEIVFEKTVSVPAFKQGVGTTEREHEGITTGKYQESTESIYSTKRLEETTGYTKSSSGTTGVVSEGTTLVSSAETLTAQTTSSQTTAASVGEETTEKATVYKEITTGEYKEKPGSTYSSTKLGITTESFSKTTGGLFEGETESVSIETTLAIGQTANVSTTEKSLRTTEKTGEQEVITTERYKPGTGSEYTSTIGVTLTTFAETTKAVVPETSFGTTEKATEYEETTTEKYEKETKYNYPSTIFVAKIYPESYTTTTEVPFGETQMTLGETTKAHGTKETFETTEKSEVYKGTTGKYQVETESVYTSTKLTASTDFGVSSTHLTSGDYKETFTLSPKTSPMPTAKTASVPIEEKSTYSSTSFETTGYPESSSITTGIVHEGTTPYTSPETLTAQTGITQGPVPEVTVKITEKPKVYQKATPTATTKIVYPETEPDTLRETTKHTSVETEKYEKETESVYPKTPEKPSVTTGLEFETTTMAYAEEERTEVPTEKETLRNETYGGVITEKYHGEKESSTTLGGTSGSPESSSRMTVMYEETTATISPSTLSAQTKFIETSSIPVAVEESVGTSEEPSILFYTSAKSAATIDFSESSSLPPEATFETTEVATATAKIGGTTPGASHVTTKFPGTVSVPATQKTLTTTQGAEIYEGSSTEKSTKSAETIAYPESSSRTSVVYKETTLAASPETTTQTTSAGSTAASMAAETHRITEKPVESIYPSTKFVGTTGLFNFTTIVFEQTTAAVSPEQVQTVISEATSASARETTEGISTKEPASGYPTIKLAGTTESSLETTYVGYTEPTGSTFAISGGPTEQSFKTTEKQTVYGGGVYLTTEHTESTGYPISSPSTTGVLYEETTSVSQYTEEAPEGREMEVELSTRAPYATAKTEPFAPLKNFSTVKSTLASKVATEHPHIEGETVYTFPNVFNETTETTSSYIENQTMMETASKLTTVSAEAILPMKSASKHTTVLPSALPTDGYVLVSPIMIATEGKPNVTEQQPTSHFPFNIYTSTPLPIYSVYTSTEIGKDTRRYYATTKSIEPETISISTSTSKDDVHITPKTTTYRTTAPTNYCYNTFDCSNSTSCIRNLCLNPCSYYNPCPEKVTCDVVVHVPVCQCPLGQGQDVVHCKILPGKETFYIGIYMLWCIRKLLD